MKKQIVLATLCLIAVLVSVSACSAVNLTVGTGGTYSNIQDAFDNAVDGDTILIANGTYTGDKNRGIKINKTLNITGASQTGTIINAQGDDYIFFIENGYTVNFSNLTLRNGECDYGGAIYNEGNCTINKVTFDNNYAEDEDGGAIYNEGTMTIIGCTFTSNDAEEDGGAILNDGTMTIANSTFTDNEADYSDGGAICNEGTMTITGCTFTGNEAADCCGGGAIYNEGTMTINNSTFTDNEADDSYGGAIYNDDTMTITGCTFTNNEAEYGGAIYNCYCSRNLTITGCTFTSNTASMGGAIFNNRYLELKYNTIKNNKALLNNLKALYAVDGPVGTVGYGGGIFLAPYSSYEIVGNHILNNTGSGIYIGYPPKSKGTAFSSKIEEEIEYKAIINFNRIYGNTPYGIYNSTIEATADVSAASDPLPPTMPTINAKYNWWGSNNGPNSAGADKTNLESAYYAPWLVMKLTPTKVVINGGETTLLTASFLYDNNGTYHDPANGHIPDGTPVTFTTSLGQVGSQTITTYTVNGIATAILRAVDAAGNLVSGIAYITATTDSQTLSTSVSIIEVPEANAATNTTNTTSTVGMQETGIPLVGLILAILALFGGLATSKRK